MAAIGDVVDGMGGRLEHGLLALVFNALTVIITEGLAEERLTVLSALEVATSVVEVSAAVRAIRCLPRRPVAWC